jgi:hypothetical protein
MANWNKLNKELDSTLDSMTSEDWDEWKNKAKDKSIINWELHQKIMAKKRTIKICTGIGLNMFFPEYITIELTDIDTEIKPLKKTKKNGKI